MATIALYKDKLNGVGSLISTMVSSTNNLDNQLGTLKSTLQGVNSSTYNLEGAVENIRSSSKTEKEKVEDLKKLNTEVDNFITVTVSRDNAAKEELNKAKEDFYTKYSYLKPECEKGFIEKVVDTVESACEWCCEHWEILVVIALVIAACVIFGPEALIPFLRILGKKIVKGVIVGGAIGGLLSAFMGGDFFEGIKEGAIFGGIFGAIGGLGGVFGSLCECGSIFVKVCCGISKVSGKMAMGMLGFDIASMIGYKLGGEDDPIYKLNMACHSNSTYNTFQRGISVLAVFTGGVASNSTCFIAGTLIVTGYGLSKIENIKPGDLVLSTNVDTMETGYKKVLEKYVRKTRELVHIVVGGEKIVSTADHPYFVVGRGFINAGQLCIGSPLQNANGKILEVEQIYKEYLEEDEEVTVYNFQVEDWHTYHVGEMEVLVHNAGRKYNNSDSGSSKGGTEAISKGKIEHVLTDHTYSRMHNTIYKMMEKGLRGPAEKLLNKKSFFNPSWSENKIIDATNQAYNKVLSQGFTNGEHTVKVLDENITVYLENGVFHSAYGDFKLTLSDFGF